jgi:hypothetical protein
VLKFDGQESPHGVYNEFVALKLAQACNIPVADGCLTDGHGYGYASFELGAPDLSLPPVTACRRDRVAERYPNEAAALVAFDMWIGNWDRGENLKATLVTPHILMFAGYDHGNSLLNVEEDPWRSIERLSTDSDQILRFHPFFGRVTQPLLENWLLTIGGLPDEIIQSCVCLEQSLRGVTVEMQEALAAALCRRKASIWDIAENALDTICRP